MITFLHCSDLNFGGPNPVARERVLDALIDYVTRRRAQGEPIRHVFCGGDLAYSAHPTQYEEATRFFDRLLGTAALTKKDLHIVPGERDCNPALAIGLAPTLGSGEEADQYFDPEREKVHITLKQYAFANWFDRYFEGIRAFPRNGTCGPLEFMDADSRRIAILPINTALFSSLTDDNGKLWVGRRCLERALRDLGLGAADMTIALLHHHPEALHPIERPNIVAALMDRIDVSLLGHTVEAGVDDRTTPYGNILFCRAGRVCSGEESARRAICGSLEADRLTILPIRYEDQPHEIWTVDPSIYVTEQGFRKTFFVKRLTANVSSRGAPARLIAPDPAAVLRFRSNIDSRREPFVGRESLLDEMLGQLGEPGDSSVLLVYGIPGIGKTELAREFARRNRASYSGGTFILDASIGPPIVDLVAIGQRILNLTFPPYVPVYEQARQTFWALAGSPVLLIYDDVQSVVGVQDWLPPDGMPCHVLITTNVDEPMSHSRVSVPRLPEQNCLQLIEEVGGPALVPDSKIAIAKLGAGIPRRIWQAALAVVSNVRRGRTTPVDTVVHDDAAGLKLAYEQLESTAHILLHAAAFLNTRRIDREELIRLLNSAGVCTQAETERQLDTCFELHLLGGRDPLSIDVTLASYLRQVERTPSEAAMIQAVRSCQSQRLIFLAEQVLRKPADVTCISRLLMFPLEPGEWALQGCAFSASERNTVARALKAAGLVPAAALWASGL